LHEQLVKETGTMPRTPKQEEILATARKSQEIMVDAIKTWVDAVRTATPRLSSFYAPFADRLPKVPSAYIARVGQLPTPKDAVASAYDLAERLLASQRKFAEDVVKATAPLMPGYSASKPEHRGETAPQDQRESARQDHGETASPEAAAGSTRPEAAAEQAPKAAEPRSTPKAAAPKSTTRTTPARSTAKATAARRAPKSAAASQAPKAATPRRAPKNSDAG
jgi:hypothetical protein